MSTTSPDFDAELDAFLAARGRTIADLGAVTQAPLVADHIAGYLATLTENTRRTYSTALVRLRDGIGPICDQTCGPCMHRTLNFRCGCPCARCVSSRLTVAPQGGLHVSATTYSLEHAKHLAAIARRIAVKAGILDNRSRAERGLVNKNVDGIGAEETCVGALRSLFATAVKYTGSNAAADVPKPRRVGGERRPLRDFELLELCNFTATTGNDPRLDELIVDFGIATGVRREGVYTLTVGQLQPDAQVVLLKDKYKRTQPAPVSESLMRRMQRHAIDRGGPICDSAHHMYRPDAPAFWQRKGNGHVPLSSRRFDYMLHRWQTNLDWANSERLGFHHLRHTIAAFLGSMYGPQYKKRYLRHADGNVTDGYGVCTFEELARAMADLLDFEHPLVHGIDERRKETLRRLGLADG